MSDKIRYVKTFAFNDFTGEEGKLIQKEARDAQGNVLHFEAYDMEGNRSQKIIRTYDEANRVKEEQQFSYGEEPDQVITYLYNESGSPASITTTYADGAKSIMNHQYDKPNRAVTIETVDEEGTNEGIEYSRYDSEGRLLEKKTTDDYGDMTEHIQITLDDHGRQLTRKVTYADGYVLDLIFEYEIDEKGRISEVYIDEKNGKPYREEFLTYDERGNIIEHEVKDLKQGYGATDKSTFNLDNKVIKQQQYTGTKLREEVTYTYLESGLLSESVTISGDGESTVRYEYEFH